MIGQNKGVQMKKIMLIVLSLIFVYSCGDNPAKPEDCVLYNMNKSTNDTLLISDVNLGTVPSCIGDMKYLRFVAFVNTGISTFPDEFFNLSELYYFACVDNPIEVLPDKFDKLTQLRYFLVSKSYLKIIPPSLFKNKELVHLNVSACPLQSIPEEIGTMTKLYWMDIRDTEVTHIPTSIKNLKDNLKYLYLFDTKISQSEIDSLRVWLPNTAVFF